MVVGSARRSGVCRAARQIWATKRVSAWHAKEGRRSVAVQTVCHDSSAMSKKSKLEKLVLVRQAEAAGEAAKATLMSKEQERVTIDAAEALAGSAAGVPAKSRKVVCQLETGWVVVFPAKWCVFPLIHVSRVYRHVSRWCIRVYS